MHSFFMNKYGSQIGNLSSYEREKSIHKRTKSDSEILALRHDAGFC